jgi:glycosyltransferase involved in cell wall biosynthesis
VEDLWFPRVDVSVVLPCYNEAGSLESLTTELYEALGRLDLTFEIVYVDDASSDDSPRILEKLRAGHRGLRVIRHARNSGESAAQATGFRRARGAVVITMDSDGQNDPGDIPRLLAALAADVACVCGVRAIRRDDWVKRISSRIGNAFRRAITGDRSSDAGCTYRAMRRAALGELPVFDGMHRFLPTLLRRQGYGVVEIPVGHRPRSAGQSKYGIGNRLGRGIADCLAMRWYGRRAVPAARALPEQPE